MLLRIEYPVRYRNPHFPLTPVSTRYVARYDHNVDTFRISAYDLDLYVRNYYRNIYAAYDANNADGDFRFYAYITFSINQKRETLALRHDRLPYTDTPKLWLVHITGWDGVIPFGDKWQAWIDRASERYSSLRKFISAVRRVNRA